MSLTITQARDDMQSMLKAAIDASSYTDMKIVYQDTHNTPPPTIPVSGDVDPWLAVEIQHFTGGQTSLGPVARYERRGQIRVSVYTEKGRGLSTSDEIAQIVLDAFEGESSAGGVWFRNCRIQEVGPDGAWSRVDVLIDFTYTQHK